MLVYGGVYYSFVLMFVYGGRFLFCIFFIDDFLNIFKYYFNV